MTIKSDKLGNGARPYCPQCDHRLDGFTSLEGRIPAEGDVTICLHCNSTLEFFNLLGQLALKPVSAETLEQVDFVELARHRELVNHFEKTQR